MSLSLYHFEWILDNRFMTLLRATAMEITHLTRCGAVLMMRGGQMLAQFIFGLSAWPQIVRGAYRTGDIITQYLISTIRWRYCGQMNTRCVVMWCGFLLLSEKHCAKCEMGESLGRDLSSWAMFMAKVRVINCDLCHRWYMFVAWLVVLVLYIIYALRLGTFVKLYV